MMKLKILVIILVIQITFKVAKSVDLSIGTKEGEENSTFIATEEWQEIKPGQKVPQGLHYRLNLQTGKKEAKLLDPEENEPQSQSSFQMVPQTNEKQEEEEASIESAKKRLEEALKNIPAETFDQETEEKWKEIKNKFKSYEEIKQDLKDLDLAPKTEAEVLTQLMEEFESKPENSLDILKDMEFILHSIDNALLFISKNGIEKIVIPHLINQTDVAQRVILLKIVGAISQNNLQAKNYLSEKTNLVNELIFLLEKHETQEELSAGLFSVGSLMRNNKILGLNNLKKVLEVLLRFLEKESLGTSLKVKSLLLIEDLILSSKDELNSFIESNKICQQLSNFFKLNKNSFLVDTDSAERSAGSFTVLNGKCKHIWSEDPNLRHALLVVMNNYMMKLREESDDDLRFFYGLVAENFESLNEMLYGDLKISSDDLSQKYNDEL
ncbi:hypothetical protein PVAND_015835 [Polypedilum vanderplanki]|uniref:Nucleotide exchange factor SIL1 n=1 Tax=Polypedilum vanderplanki TaxID=319348 RepID=A0A9J6BDD5_POLVA|nr:hypothetical protein PVAND_015835 [Polypedilum vanderplanki]